MYLNHTEILVVTIHLVVTKAIVSSRSIKITFIITIAQTDCYHPRVEFISAIFPHDGLETFHVVVRVKQAAGLPSGGSHSTDVFSLEGSSQLEHWMHVILPFFNKKS